ncbi:MAG: RNA 3'-phosphate cyclase [Candidatus Cloacimonadota bacterium]|nr:MAG: RNA 3'-phosphate cyclase [Candidatus Cloacimonadota bacterium]
MIKVDGSFGEGGGQILRSSLTLAMMTNQAFEIINIRANRKKSGLLRQHLTAVKAAIKISNAKVEGDFIGSTKLSFFPSKVESGDYDFKVGSAGSCILVLQTILPALMLLNKKSTLYLEGGTHNPMAPPFDFLKNSFLPVLKKMGVDVEMSLKRAGFYPAGGGQLCIIINPIKCLSRVSINEFGDLLKIKPKIIHSNLPFSIASRELSTIRKKLNIDFDDRDCIEQLDSIGPGNVVAIDVITSTITQSFYSFAFRGIKAESIAQNCINQVNNYINIKAPIGEFLCDQLIIPMVYAKGSLLCSNLSMHTKTNIEIVKKFIDIEIEIKKINDVQVQLIFI